MGYFDGPDDGAGEFGGAGVPGGESVLRLVRVLREAGWDPAAGRVSAVAVDPGDAAHVLVGAGNGGVWGSWDRGESWRACTGSASTLAVGALAFDPGRPGTVYCGTGEGDCWFFLGAGLLASVDGGVTWSVRCSDPFVGQGFYQLLVDPRDSGRLLAATTGGMYTSDDAGSTWIRRHPECTWSMALGRAEILAASSDGVWQSGYDAKTFKRVRLEGAPSRFTRLAVATAPTDPAIAYAWGTGEPFDSEGNPTAYLWRRARNTWSAQQLPPGVRTAQSWYDWFLAVAPDNANQIYAGAISVHRGDRCGSGWTWMDIGAEPESGGSPTDQHAIAFEPGAPGIVYIGCDGGLFRSSDRGRTWSRRGMGISAPTSC
ncbi:hypothetical protein OHB26_26365 [Nocardia sp. NBC_01503]|uniref:hypothetical protein n=1 Tax=Nocardia sp. NBC_01503 TaxID=2975997 RepID=UPI002E7B9A16|nr:hypothetical protein [Nocardia sp. NBC_01503]WTL30442.1 hypothetical protein OHB26_26365 [Nocardia sp. NBC_01503]